MAAGVRIWLLGGFRVEVDSRPVPDDAWRRNKAKAVVKLLALAPSQRLHREQLMDALWPELPPDAAAANLRKAVHFARQALAPEHLESRREVLELAAEPLWIDVHAFQAAADAGDLAAAIELYAGELLPEDRFEDWAEQRREQLGARFSRLLLERAAELEAAGDLSGAAEALERLAAVDPLNEPAATGLMRVYALAGQRHLAMGRYRQLGERLAEELGVEPGAAARRLHQEIATGRFPAAEPAGPAAPAAPGPLVEERKLVTAVLVDATAAPAGGDPERARLELERWSALVCEVLRSWGGTAERLVGGSAVAVFGIPRVHEDDAARGLSAGLEILKRSPLPARVGVATGEVIAPAGQGASPVRSRARRSTPPPACARRRSRARCWPPSAPAEPPAAASGTASRCAFLAWRRAPTGWPGRWTTRRPRRRGCAARWSAATPSWAWCATSSTRSSRAGCRGC